MKTKVVKLAATSAVAKKLTARLAVAQKSADAARKQAKSAKVEFKSAKKSWKEAKRVAKASRKVVKTLRAELAGLAKKPKSSSKTVRRKAAVQSPASASPVARVAEVPPPLAEVTPESSAGSS